MVLFGGGEQIQHAGEQIEQVEILACVHLLPCMLQVGLEWCAEAVMAAAEVHAARVPGVSAGFARLRSAPPPPVGSAIPTSPAAAGCSAQPPTAQPQWGPAARQCVSVSGGKLMQGVC